ncbi:MAG: sulfotransferase family protein [Cyanobacteria bacterium M5B4]|nr:MAG: sulfotransferase family protein [Cyanobacteria bacterium M5B4]
MVLIITGMHRSGTSLTASLFQQLGVNMGGNLVPADRHNPKGYFEDVDFLEFQRQVLQKCCDPNDPGWHDWGWTVHETLNPQLFERYSNQAEELLQKYKNNKTLWGWKDPRTTLMLDFWHNLIPHARYLFLFRYPWDVADSIKRLNAPIFTDHPEYILPIWRYYNQKLIDFYQQCPDKCILFCVNHLDRFGELIRLCQTKLNLSLPSFKAEIIQATYDRDLFHQLPPDQTIDDATAHILWQLQEAADIKGDYC